VKVVVLTIMLSPYRVPLLNAIHHGSQDSWTALFLHGSLSDRDWPDHTGRLDMAHEVLVPTRASGVSERLLAARLTWTRLTEIDPDMVVVGGYVDPACWIALTWARTRGRPAILWMATWAGSRFRKGPVSLGLSQAYVRACSGFVAYSTRAADYLEELGAEREAIFVGPNVGDTGFFGPAVAEARRAAPAHSGVARLLYVGVLSHRKAIDLLITALTLVECDAWTLRLVGSGPEQERLEESIRDKGWQDRVRFVPHCAPHELVAHYAESDIFVLPSRIEPGAIVLGEALASGLYTIVSDADGVAPDLVQPGVSGAMVDTGDAEAFAKVLDDAIARALGDRLDPPEIARTVAGKGPDNYAQAFLRAASLCGER